MKVKRTGSTALGVVLEQRERKMVLRITRAQTYKARRRQPIAPATQLAITVKVAVPIEQMPEWIKTKVHWIRRSSAANP